MKGMNGRRYACGPTVYDETHLGHARTYVTFDMMRRAWQEEFHLCTTMAMGITDIDDKIIERARSLRQPPRQVALYFEERFFEAMRELGVRPPDMVCRVTEHIPEIVDFVQQLLEKGMAYRAVDGVYFDSEAMRAVDPGFPNLRTGKALVQSAVDASEQTSASELRVREKKHPADFALWKLTKVEPEAGVSTEFVEEENWDTALGRGRPGWHIECSAMATHLFGSHLDLHTGGVDLAFPHHQNEVLQCNALHHCPHNQGVDSQRAGPGWCSYFLHAGHLHIQGQKMSKSLKNYTTVQEFLRTHSANHFRIFCAMHHYAASIHFSEESIQEAASFERRCQNFVDRVCLSGQKGDIEVSVPCIHERWDASHVGMKEAVDSYRQSFRIALSEDFDTPRALSVLEEMISYCHDHLDRGCIPKSLALHAMHALFQSLHSLGISLRLPASEGAQHNAEKATAMLVHTLTNFRQEVRSAALEALRQASKQPAPSLANEVLSRCDQLRDNILPDLGVLVKDLPGGTSGWTWMDPDNTQKEGSPNSVEQKPSS